MRHLRSLLTEPIFALIATLSTTVGCAPYGMPFGRRPPPSCATVCAFGIPDVRTSIRDTSDGVDVTFGVVGNDPTELRQRAHGAVAGTYPIRPGTQALARRVRVTIHDEEDGLVMHVVPLDPAELDSVRDAVRKVVAEDEAMSCK